MHCRPVQPQEEQAAAHHQPQQEDNHRCRMVSHSSSPVLLSIDYYSSFYQKICNKVIKNMGLRSGIRDPGAGKSVPDPGSRVKKATDPGGSATLRMTEFSQSTIQFTIVPYRFLQ